MINLGLQARAFLLAFIPMLMITSILSIYFIRGQLIDIDSSIDERGISMATHLANASEFGLFSGNIDSLISLLNTSSNEEDVKSISIWDNSGNLVVKVPDNTNNKRPPTKHKTRTFRQSIILHTTPISDLNDPAILDNETEHNDLLGWLDIEISTSRIQKKRDEAILDSLVLIVFGMISSILLAFWMSRSLTTPIKRLTNAVSEIEKGNLETQIMPESSGEIGMLERGFDSMLGKVRLTQQDLQHKIDETTSGLKNSLELVEKQNAELVIARKNALDASKSKSRFLANISHEIRTPMNGILGFVRLLKNSKLTREQNDYLETIEKSSNNLLNLIEDILDLSRAEAGKVQINNIPFNLRDCIEDVIMLMAPAVLEKDLDINYIYYSDTPTDITAPYERIRQVLINYIGNAIKFSEQGTIVIRVMLDPATDTTDSIKISVTDQGIGVSESDKEGLFSPFTQIDDTSTRKYSGTGLGLAISKSITKAMGGEVGLDNNPEGGSVFWFTFQCKMTSNQPVIPHSPLISNQIPVYIHDNNSQNLDSITANLRGAGLTTTKCQQPDEIIELLEKNKENSICILSLSQRELTNDKTKSEIKKILGFSNTKLLLLVSSLTAIDASDKRLHGAHACLTKPYRNSDLIQTLNNLISTDNIKAITGKPNHYSHGKNNLLNNIHILIVEDNLINTKLIQTVLNKSGAVTMHAENGKLAIETLHDNYFDIILMDIQMPVMNGLDATRNIRKLKDKGETIPIIGMTANAIPGDEHEYSDAGLNSVLIKPIAVDDLINEIQYWVRLKALSKNNTHRRRTDITLKEATDQDNPQIDVSKLGINKELSETLYDMLIDELPHISDQIEKLSSLNDWESLREVIHKLLGGLSYCDVPDLRKSTLQFQTSLRSQSKTLEADKKTLLSEIIKLLESSSNNTNTEQLSN